MLRLKLIFEYFNRYQAAPLTCWRAPASLLVTTPQQAGYNNAVEGMGIVQNGKLYGGGNT